MSSIYCKDIKTEYFQLLDKYVFRDGGSTPKKVDVCEPYKHVWQFVKRAATR